ncbi:MAG: O-antigen ligase family protein [Firmicutes bacterium]|nr:O-antigen ligase family protein [Bacillota bacterium]
MNNKLSLDKRIIGLVGAFLFISPNLNIPESILTYCGIEDHETARLISLVLFVMLDVAIGLAFLKNRPSKKMIGILVVFNALYILPLLLSWDKIVVLQYIMFVLPVTILSVAFCADDEVKESFFMYLRYICRALLVIAVVYIVLQYVSSDRNFRGIVQIHNMTYGDMGYLFLTGFVMSLIDIAEKRRVIGFLGLVIFALAVFFSGTRSAILCAAFAVLLLIVLAFMKSTREEKRAMVIGIGILIVTMIVGLLIVPSGSRLNFLHVDLTDPDFSIKSILFETTERNKRDRLVIYVPTNEEMYLSDIYTEEIINNDKPKAETQKILRNDVKSNKNKYIKLINEEDREAAEKFRVTNHRTFLWKAAIAEYKKSPLIGNGSRYFTKKYSGFSPHNIFLEMMSDYGIIGLVLLTGLGIYCFVRGFRLYHKTGDANLFRIILLLFSHVPRYLFYTTLYSNCTIAMTVIIFVFMGRLAGKQGQ